MSVTHFFSKEKKDAQFLHNQHDPAFSVRVPNSLLFACVGYGFPENFRESQKVHDFAFMFFLKCNTRASSVPHFRRHDDFGPCFCCSLKSNRLCSKLDLLWGAFGCYAECQHLPCFFIASVSPSLTNPTVYRSLSCASYRAFIPAKSSASIAMSSS